MPKRCIPMLIHGNISKLINKHLAWELIANFLTYTWSFPEFVQDSTMTCRPLFWCSSAANSQRKRQEGVKVLVRIHRPFLLQGKQQEINCSPKAYFWITKIWFSFRGLLSQIKCLPSSEKANFIIIRNVQKGPHIICSFAVRSELFRPLATEFQTIHLLGFWYKLNIICLPLKVSNTAPNYYYYWLTLKGCPVQTQLPSLLSRPGGQAESLINLL